MAGQDTTTNDQQTQQGQQVTRGQQQRDIGRPRPSSFLVSPADFFRLGPFELLRRFSQEMDRSLSDASGTDQPAMARWTPSIEVSEREGQYIVRVDLPGVKPDDVRLEITDDAVILEGERKDTRERDQGGVHVTERRYGRFYRVIPLPEGAKTDAAAARFDNGVLEIDIPVEQQKSQRRQIQIQSGSQGQQSQTGQSPQNQTGTGGAPSKAA
jgi:HSP20 family protein